MQILKHESNYYQTTSFRWRQRIGFGISDYACNLAYLLANTYLLFYYTNCAGLAAGAVGFMFVVTKFIDAGTDYLVGVMVDHTDTKMGRYRPWMLFGAPVLAVGMILLFSVPTGWGAGAKLAWAYITYVIFSFGYTLVNIPLTPIVTALSSNPAERTKISTTRQVFANLGSLTSSLFVIPMVYYFAGSSDATGAALAVGYRNTNIVLGIVVVVIMCICVFSIVEINPPTQTAEKSTFLQDLGNAFKNKYYIMLLILIFVMYAGYLGMYGAMQYYYNYVIGDVSAMPTALSLLTILAIPTMIVAAFLNGKGIHKVKIVQMGAVIDLAGYLILFFTSNSAVATAALGLIGFGFGFRSGMFFSMMPDVFDYTEWKCGRCLAGTQSAISGFLNKLASASASAIVSAFLAWGGYNAVKLDNAIAAGQKIAEVFPKTHMAINFAFSGLSIVTAVIAILVMIPYDLDKKYPGIRADLDKRRSKNPEV
ncbi:MAG: glycoside-pentoside-hexuronide (GPH):cation symporter [Lachnospiraceae bacterium]|nr:glycoside-pentoside-hexuronide (GPH):cation symporter [Lachnospiraceae bacterium]